MKGNNLVWNRLPTFKKVGIAGLYWVVLTEEKDIKMSIVHWSKDHKKYIIHLSPVKYCFITHIINPDTLGELPKSDDVSGF